MVKEIRTGQEGRYDILQNAEGEKKYVIGLSMNTQTNPFFVDVKDGVQKAADEKGIELYITDAQDDPAIQMKDIENLITKNPDAIIIDTCDSDAIVASVEALPNLSPSSILSLLSSFSFWFSVVVLLIAEPKAPTPLKVAPIAIPKEKFFIYYNPYILQQKTRNH